MSPKNLLDILAISLIKWTTRTIIESAVCSTTRKSKYKVNDIALFENGSTQAQRLIAALEHEAKIVGLEINFQKTKQMRLNQS